MSGVYALGFVALLVAAGLVVRLLIRRTHELQEANERLQRLSLRDGLTGAANRRHFEAIYEREWRRAIRAKRSLALLMIDIDEFKKYNDAFGHPAGDGCLIRIAALFDAEVHRGADFVARYGGEEFAVILPDTDLTGAAGVAERLRADVEALRIERDAAGPTNVVTISVGVAAGLPGVDISSPELLLASADRALYEAKQTGRNRITIATAPAT
jgi:diguanylate cyclase (GGDEF)-like protein